MRDVSAFIIRRSEVVADGGDSSALERDARAGCLRRLAAGAYVRSDDWGILDPEEQHAARVHAVVPRLGLETFVSHESALALQGFPLLGDWPTRVHVIARGRPRAKVSAGLHRHAVPLSDDEWRMVQGLPVVLPARAAVDVVRDRDLRGGAVVLDHGLASGAFVRADLDAVLADRCRVPGSRRAAASVAFADGRSGSPGESLSRAVIHAAGLRAPVLQARFPASGPLVGIVDFWWPCCGVIGEFDGESKYLDEALRGGRTAKQVVIDEKWREDALRAQPDVRGFVRWDWSDALRGEPLLQKLARAGVC
ncbi:hypothetical protein EDF38_3059 [Frigoribacterium sp. PhB160]|uniref:hypothetical protein n=1 Tax=Frigoribacterium sp. PhB160 TaxID=2485192 RepID=UPI000F48A62D|nr:hypothetical protein [Frigoribacterium sp. PhB160]ROS58316.1 hypothetical protein EDF38_3059 [Frigoribacterium sp. PhB160]